MRDEKNNPQEEYRNFWDWLARLAHMVFFLVLPAG